MGGFLDVLKAIDPVNAIASLGSSVINAYSQHETNEANAAQNDLSRQFSAQQAQLDRDFNAAQSDNQNAFNAAEAKKSRVFNADQARQQMQFQEKMWNAQNEYNDPSAQLARLKAAGINPNWNDGFDNTAGSVSGGAAATSSPASGSPAFHGSVGAPSNIPMSPVTVENPLMMGAQIRLANAQAEKAESDAERTRKLLPGEVRIQGKTYDLVGSEVDVNNAQVKNLEKMASKQDAEINLINENIGKIQSETSLIDKQGNLVQKEIDSFEQKLVSALQEAASRVKLNLANAGEVASKIALNYANAEKARLEGQSYVLDNYLDSCKLALYKNDSAWTYSILQNGIRLDAADRSRRSKHESAEFEPDYKMYEQMNNDVIAFLRALGSVVNFSLGSHASVRP